MAYLSEAAVEGALLEQLSGLGYNIEREEDVGPDGNRPERDSHSEVVLTRRLRDAVARINPGLLASVREEAVRKVLQSEFPSLLEENRRVHKLITDGVEVEYLTVDGTVATARVLLVDFEEPDKNDWLAVNQFAVIAGRRHRRADVVVFVNGLPLAVVELKAPGSGNATLLAAFNQLQTYKEQIPRLFSTNFLLVISDGLTARFGSLSADLERFMPWRTIDGKTLAPKSVPELQTLIQGLFDHQRLLSLLRHYVVFGETGSKLVKIIAGYHQFHAVHHAIERTLAASSPMGDQKVGVIWHTQGSGKSLLMAFYAGQLIRHPLMANPTLVVLTDRNDLDDQLFSTFAMCRDLIRQTPVQTENREDLQKVLSSRVSGGVVFTTIQKFVPREGGTDYPELSDRRNIVVIVDEAHRSQYGFRAKFHTKTGAISYGFAKYLRDALPNASFIGFTGTPIEADDVNTPAVFGDYIDIYDISRSIEDRATVPIYYESRLARIELDDSEKPVIDAEVEALTEDETLVEQERIKRKWATVEALVGSQKRLSLVAEDIVQHFEDRVAAIDGKAMVVCMSRRICVNLYNEIIKLRPHWHSPDDNSGAIKIVMTGAASDPPEWQEHIGSKSRRDLLAKRVRDPDDALKLVVVRDMWLTGFDAPCLHTMYVDKPMRGHGLMQAIARVNRVFREKPAGLIVDYIGIAQNLKTALRQYSRSDQERIGLDAASAIAVMMEKYEIVRDMFHGFDYASALNGAPQERLLAMAGAVEWILEFEQKLSANETNEEGKRKVHRRYQDAVLALTKAYALVSASDQARRIREEVGFFQAIRVALVKTSISAGESLQHRDLAIQQIVSRAVISTEIVDILAATGLSSPNMSILSDEFLLEMQQIKHKNLALEALKKLISDSIRSRSRTNVTQTKAFSERLEEALARYHSNAITTAEVIQQLIELAKDIRTAQQRGEESGLSEDEIAFYDALAENESALQLMGNDKLRIIAHELLVSLRENVSVDWISRDSARARMRVLVKRILRRYGYPPDLQDSAVQVVLRQAEALSYTWSVAEASSRPDRVSDFPA